MPCSKATSKARALFYRQYELLEYITRRGLPTTIKPA